MNEKIILKENGPSVKTEGEKKPRKKYYKPKKKKETIEKELHEVVNAEKPFVSGLGFKVNMYVGKYCIGTGKMFCIHLENKPNWLHRKCMKLLLGWKWTDNEM